MPAAVKVEEAGLPVVAIVASGFQATCRAHAATFGHAVRTAIYPGVIMTDDQETFQEKVLGPVLDGVILGLTAEDGSPAEFEDISQPQVQAMAAGTVDEVQELFLSRGWSDGLPIVRRPPIVSRRFFASQTERPTMLSASLNPPAARSVRGTSPSTA
jgi:hypothetical protein